MPVVRSYLVRHASSHPRTRGVFVHWQVMELCRGGELFERIQQQQQFDEKSAAVLVRGMGECVVCSVVPLTSTHTVAARG